MSRSQTDTRLIVVYLSRTSSLFKLRQKKLSTPLTKRSHRPNRFANGTSIECCPTAHGAIRPDRPPARAHVCRAAAATDLPRAESQLVSWERTAPETRRRTHAPPPPPPPRVCKSGRKPAGSAHPDPGAVPITAAATEKRLQYADARVRR